MKVRTAALTVLAPKGRVFRYLSDIRNLPKWATEFCRELKMEGGRHKVLTCPAMGSQELFVQVQADEETGVMDYLVGPSEDRMAVFPARVVQLPGGASLILFTLLQAPGTSDEQFEAQYQSLKKEFENIKQEFVKW